MEKLIRYAYSRHEKNLVHITEVDNGLMCDCACVVCGEPLVAKNLGKKNQHHFAHAKETLCSPSETLLHLLAKEALRNIGKVYIPVISYDVTPRHDILKVYFPGKSREKYNFGNYYNVKNVRTEERLDDIVPDLAANVFINGEPKEFLIEVAVTHFIDDHKLVKIKNKYLNCIEIDLGKFYKERKYFDLSDVQSYLISEKRIYRLVNQTVYHEQVIREKYQDEFDSYNRNLIHSVKSLGESIVGTWVDIPSCKNELEYIDKVTGVRYCEIVDKKMRDIVPFYVSDCIHDARIPNCLLLISNTKKLVVIFKSDYQGSETNFIFGDNISTISFLAKGPVSVDTFKGHFRWRFHKGYKKAKWRLYFRVKNKPSLRTWNTLFSL